MKLFKPFFFLFLFPLLFACKQKIASSINNRFTGLWELHAMEQKDAETGKWQEWRDGMQGYLLYGEDNSMALHLTTKGYEKTPLRFPNFVDTIPYEAMAHLTNSYVYFAKYTIDEEKRIIQHARISHSNPGEWNDIVDRRFSFEGDTMTLQPVEERISSLRVRWIRASKSNSGK